MNVNLQFNKKTLYQHISVNFYSSQYSNIVWEKLVDVFTFM